MIDGVHNLHADCVTGVVFTGRLTADLSYGDAVPTLRQRCEHSAHRSVVAESLADVDEAIDVARAEHETRAELKRIFAESVLVVTGGFGAVARDAVFAAQKVQQVRVFQLGSSIGVAPGIDEQRKRDARLFTEDARILKVAEADGGEIRASSFDLGFVLAQLRNVLAAEDSAVVAQKDDDGRPRGPERAETNEALIGVRQCDISKPRAESGRGHDNGNERARTVYRRVVLFVPTPSSQRGCRCIRSRGTARRARTTSRHGRAIRIDVRVVRPRLSTRNQRQKGRRYKPWCAEFMHVMATPYRRQIRARHAVHLLSTYAAASSQRDAGCVTGPSYLRIN